MQVTMKGIFLKVYRRDIACWVNSSMITLIEPMDEHKCRVVVDGKDYIHRQPADDLLDTLSG